MTKREIVGIAGGFGAALVLVSAGLFWHGHQAHIKQLALARAKAASAQQTVGDHVISLTPAATDTDSSNGLAVTNSSGAASLGQLDRTQQNETNGSTGSSSSSSGSQGLDPTKFGEYDKYKDSQNVLFGDMQVGSGTELTANHKAAVLYKGWLTNGQVFDQSRPGSDGKLQPFVFTPGAHQVILGWENGVLGMKVGGTRVLVVPPAVGYGAQGQGPVPGNAVMVFEIQLLAVE